VDDRSDAEVSLFRPGRNLRIKEILSKLGRIKSETGVASAASVFYIEGGEQQ